MEPIITWKDFQRAMPWEIVILVGGGYALASGSKVSHRFCSLGLSVPQSPSLLRYLGLAGKFQRCGRRGDCSVNLVGGK